ncbi:hypothetical protein GSI_07405 [Ganoderma sinense ZZ0214-1]|uniref:Uncharacterized protein n=1 Tax=Ganoderma sinense ZZ0214-1 TaxID=1077348 RepID=A0A2G8S9H5_9APHY|nr:hypothetical protein GSI_07405 [Ganoderma sinense ZZ0214-1]
MDGPRAPPNTQVPAPVRRHGYRTRHHPGKLGRWDAVAVAANVDDGHLDGHRRVMVGIKTARDTARDVLPRCRQEQAAEARRQEAGEGLDSFDDDDGRLDTTRRPSTRHQAQDKRCMSGDKPSMVTDLPGRHLRRAHEDPEDPADHDVVVLRPADENPQTRAMQTSGQRQTRRATLDGTALRIAGFTLAGEPATQMTLNTLRHTRKASAGIRAAAYTFPGAPRYLPVNLQRIVQAATHQMDRISETEKRTLATTSGHDQVDATHISGGRHQDAVTQRLPGGLPP